MDEEAVGMCARSSPTGKVTLWDCQCARLTPSLQSEIVRPQALEVQEDVSISRLELPFYVALAALPVDAIPALDCQW